MRKQRIYQYSMVYHAHFITDKRNLSHLEVLMHYQDILVSSTRKRLFECFKMLLIPLMNRENNNGDK